MDNKTNDTLLVIATVIMILMGIVLWKQNYTLKEYKDMFNSIDTTSVVIQHDTIYTDVDTTVTQPIIIKETIIRTDTLYTSDGDSIPVKKKTRLIPIQ